jgi:hypothetical protein
MSVLHPSSIRSFFIFKPHRHAHPNASSSMCETALLPNADALLTAEDHVWFEDRWMVAPLCDELLTTLCGLILG